MSEREPDSLDRLPRGKDCRKNAASIAAPAPRGVARRYVLTQFGALGTHLLIALPGRTETGGVTPGIVMAKTPRPLTLDDALALQRSPAVRRIAPLVVGTGEVRYQALRREATILGTTAEMREVRHLDLAQGQFLPADDPRSARAFVVLGAKVARELFGGENPLCARLRVAGERYRVIGVMERKGQVLGFDLDDAVYVPVGRALELLPLAALRNE